MFVLINRFTLIEQTQTLDRAEKTLKFEQDKEAALVQNIDEKIHALNKMIFDMGSRSSPPTLRDPIEKNELFGSTSRGS